MDSPGAYGFRCPCGLCLHPPPQSPSMPYRTVCQMPRTSPWCTLHITHLAELSHTYIPRRVVYHMPRTSPSCALHSTHLVELWATYIPRRVVGYMPRTSPRCALHSTHLAELWATYIPRRVLYTDACDKTYLRTEKWVAGSMA